MRKNIHSARALGLLVSGTGPENPGNGTSEKRTAKNVLPYLNSLTFDALGLRLLYKKGPHDSSGGIGMVRKSETSPVLVSHRHQDRVFRRGTEFFGGTDNLVSFGKISSASTARIVLIPLLTVC
jgi:hypothetical protein